jgi:4-hydroxy-4-methyl-2-oxoglutarate aldolase
MASSPVYMKIPACDPALVEQIGQFGVADLHEALGPVFGLRAITSPAMRSIMPGTRAYGQAITIENYPGDNLMLYAGMDLVEAGQMLVISNGGGWHGAQLGDVASTYLKARGVAGAVVDGPVRDVQGLREMGFPVWATSISVSHPEKRGPGAVNRPVVVAGALIAPGDIVVADSDGVIAIPPSQALACIERAHERAEREKVFRARVGAGESIADVVGLRDTLNGPLITRYQTAWHEDQA